MSEYQQSYCRGSGIVTSKSICSKRPIHTCYKQEYRNLIPQTPFYGIKRPIHTCYMQESRNLIPQTPFYGIKKSSFVFYR